MEGMFDVCFGVFADRNTADKVDEVNDRKARSNCLHCKSGRMNLLLNWKELLHLLIFLQGILETNSGDSTEVRAARIAAETPLREEECGRAEL